MIDLSNNIIRFDVDNMLCFSAEDRKSFFETHREKIGRMVSQSDASSLVLKMCRESSYDDIWLDQFRGFLCSLKKEHPSLEIFLICNSWFRSLIGSALEYISDILYVDFFLVNSYHNLCVRKITHTVTHWNADDTKILFLMGKSDRIHRIRLLYKLLRTTVSQGLHWSFTINDESQKQRCRLFLSDVSDDDFAQLIKKQRSFDEWFLKDGDGIPSDKIIYDHVLFQIISETNFQRPWRAPWITEKTWTSIINRRPFIMASEFHTLDRLESMGFNTFRDFLPIPNYDNPDRNDFLHYGPLSGKTGLIVTGSQKKSWSEFYDRYRDTSWPENLNIDDIHILPEDVRAEIGKHYAPPIEDLSDMRLDAIVENAVFWQENIHRFKDEISNQINENHARSITLAKENLIALEKFSARNAIIYSIDDLLRKVL